MGIAGAQTGIYPLDSPGGWHIIGRTPIKQFDAKDPVEKEYLALSGRMITYMQCLRFLADYLNGDIYYKIHHPLHNLQRVRAQLTLLRDMEAQYDEMIRIIKNITR